MTNPVDVAAEQRAHWNGPGAEMWVQRQAQMDASLAPVSRATIALAAPRTGEHVLDIGCGTGDSCLALADLVGPGGHVTGLDISAPMLGLARTRAEGRANISLRLEDAAAASLPAESFDLLFSRFGVMFFGDPVAAFTNMHRAMKPDGRLAFACWRPPANNPWVRIPLQAARPFLELDGPAPPGLPGQFSFGDANHVATILESAGFAAPSFSVFNLPMPMGKSLDEAVGRMSTFGSLARAMEAAPEAQREKALAAIRAAVAPYAAPDGFVAIQGSVWLVSARAR